MRNSLSSWGFLCLLLLFVPLTLPAEELVLSLDNALDLAIENNLNLQKSLLDLSSAEYSAKRLWAEIFPSINGTASAGYGSALFSGDGFAFNEKGQTYSTSVGISLGLNAGIPYTMKNIKLAYQSKLLSYEDARSQLAIQTTKTFYGIITDQNNLGYLADILNLAERQYEKNLVAFRNGLIGELALRQSQLGLENARYSLSAARSAYANRMGEFLALLGIEPDTQASLAGKISIAKIEVNAEELIREHLKRRPDIVRCRQEIERLETLEKQAALSSKAPSLRLSLDWNSPSFDPFADTLRGSAALTIPIDPWVPGTKTSQSIRAAQINIEKAKLDLKSAEDSAATGIRSLAANLRNSWDSIEIARLSLEIAERGYELTEQGFRGGLVESLALGDARNNLSDARRRLLQGELSYMNMILDLSAALNINWKDLIQ